MTPEEIREKLDNLLKNGFHKVRPLTDEEEEQMNGWVTKRQEELNNF